MANTYFQSKQFIIQQDKCAMKVCTDACLFGALVANQNLQITNCLDIGTGTGLLSLMLAQKNDRVKIDTVEIDTAAANQAVENIAGSPWPDRIQVFNEDILMFDSKKKYDCIISNPPFFEDDLQSADKAKNDAKHNTSLNLLQLLQVVDKCLEPKGFFAVLLPYHRVEYLIEEAKKLGLFLCKQTLVKHTDKHKFFRAILFFNRKETDVEFLEIIIRDAEQNYTYQFTEALKEYYLFL